MGFKFKRIVDNIRNDIESGILSVESKLPSFSKIEERYNVSRITVVRAMNELKDKGFVCHRKKRKGYFVSDAYKVKRRFRFKRLGVLFHASSDKQREHPFMIEITNSIRAICEAIDYKCVLHFHVDDEKLNYHQLRTIMATLDGCVVGGYTLSNDCMMEVAKMQDNVVLYGNYFPYAHIPTVVNDYSGVWLAMEHLYETGKREIAYIANPYLERMALENIYLYFDACNRLGITRCLNYVTEETHSEEKIIAQIDQLLKQKVDGMIFMDELNAACAANYLTGIKVRVPDDVGIVCYGGTDFVRYTNPPITTICLENKHIGELLVNKLLNHLDSKCEYSSVSCIPSRLIVRDSTLARTES